MEKKIKNVKTLVISILVLIVIGGLISNKLKSSNPQEDVITFYDTELSENTEKSTILETIITEDAITPPVDENPSNGKISINKATKNELMSIKGIGETKANAIIEYREKYNGFVSIEEIKQVKGIGDATYNKIKDLICL